MERDPGDGDDRKSLLVADLDGTLLPLPGNEQNERDLKRFIRLVEEHEIELVYATGRNRDSALEAIHMHGLPNPRALICNVGTEIWESRDGVDLSCLTDYSEQLAGILSTFGTEELSVVLDSITDLQLRPPAKQGEFKLAYGVRAARLEVAVSTAIAAIRERNLPFSIIHSQCVETGDGFVDIVPNGISKASAVLWYADRMNIATESVVYAGDSGNDLAALCEGFRSIVVSNAQHGVARQVFDAHRSASWRNRLFLANRAATSGLLDGCHWFELFPSNEQVLPTSLGAVPISASRTHLRVWAPKRKTITVEKVTGDKRAKSVGQLLYESDGYFSGTLKLSPGDSYQFRLERETRRPDPTSRYQPHGVHRESQVVQHQFPWSLEASGRMWKGVEKSDLVIYELHIGTFTEEGTFLSAIERIPELVNLGITAIELLPIAQSPGKWNWGYDGVNLFAVRNSYGTPNEFRELVDACHTAGIAVLLDVVYNHLGPEGNYLADFGRYYSPKHRTPWGEALDFDGRNAKPVRRFIVENVLYWLREFRLDGLRLDAVHFMFDDSEYTILDEIRDEVLDFEESVDRRIHLIAEANIFDRHLVVGRHSDSGVSRHPYCASWCDDIMHSIYSLGVSSGTMTHRQYRGAEDLAESLTHGFIFTGPTPTRVAEQDEIRRQLSPSRDYLASLVVALQTHDSVGNHPHGKRLHHLTSVEFQMAAAALVLLYPAIPMIFMGEEYAADSVFPFFVDFEDHALRKRVDRGRASEYPKHSWDGALSPSNPEAFYLAKCDGSHQRNHTVARWYRDLLARRRQLREVGLLRPENLTVQSDIEQNYFQLSYACCSGDISQVHVRLRAHDELDPVPRACPIVGDIVLDSRDSPLSGASEIYLQANQAVITHRPS